MQCRKMATIPTPQSEFAAGRRLQTAIEKVYTEHKCVTPDVGGNASTDAFTDAVIRAI